MDIVPAEKQVLYGGDRDVPEFLDPDIEAFMTPQELQRYLRIGRTKCYELLAQNAIPSFLVGRLRRVKRSDVDLWLETRRYAPWE